MPATPNVRKERSANAGMAAMNVIEPAQAWGLVRSSTYIAAERGRDCPRAIILERAAGPEPPESPPILAP